MTDLGLCVILHLLVDSLLFSRRFVSVQEEISFFYGRVIRELFVLLRVK